MVEHETDLNGNPLTREEEIRIIYDGPSFDGKMELSNLTSQLKSTDLLIREIVSELYKQKGLKNPDEIKIFLRLKRGSFQEIISIVLNNPTTAAIIGGCIVALFERLLKKEEKGNNLNIKIENLVNNYLIVKNLNNIITPLEDKDDKIEIISSNPKIKTSVDFKEKKTLISELREIKEKIAVEMFEEDFFGYLSIVDLDKEKYGFTLEGTNQHIPLIFDNKPTLDEIRNILGYRIKITARATYEEKDLRKLEVQKYELKKRENLKDFYKE